MMLKCPNCNQLIDTTLTDALPDTQLERDVQVHKKACCGGSDGCGCGKHAEEGPGAEIMLMLEGAKDDMLPRRIRRDKPNRLNRVDRWEKEDD